MTKPSSAIPITYSFRERLLINFSLATFLLILAQLPWPLARASFVFGGTIFLATLGWAVVKIPLPQVRISVNIPRPVEVVGLDEVRFSLLLLAVSLLLGIFYILSFIRFLNAHDGLTMFFVWEGLR